MAATEEQQPTEGEQAPDEQQEKGGQLAAVGQQDREEDFVPPSDEDEEVQASLMSSLNEQRELQPKMNMADWAARGTYHSG